MKKLFFLLSAFLSLSAAAQVKDQTVTSAVPATGTGKNNQTLHYANAAFDLNLRVPHAASWTLNGAKDSIGYLMFNVMAGKFGVYTGNGNWQTFVSPGENISTFNNNAGYITGNFNGFDSRYKAFGYVPAWAEITGKPSFFSGNYGDLTGKPDLSLFITAGYTGFDGRYKPFGYVPAWAEITGKPSFFSGNYGDLAGKPTFGSAAYQNSSDFLPSTYSAPVTKFNTRTGDIIPQASDYSLFYPGLQGANANGTWDIDVTGQANTITNQKNSATITADVNATAGTIVQRDVGSGIAVGYVNTLATLQNDNSISSMYATNDNFIRKYSAGPVRAFLGLGDLAYVNLGATVGINIIGNATHAINADNATIASSAGAATNAENVANDAAYMRFHWNGQAGQPVWLWGGNDPNNMYVFNPSNFNVAFAVSAGSVDWSNVLNRFTKLSQFTNDLNLSGLYHPLENQRLSTTSSPTFANIYGTNIVAQNVTGGNTVSGNVANFNRLNVFGSAAPSYQATMGVTLDDGEEGAFYNGTHSFTYHGSQEVRYMAFGQLPDFSAFWRMLGPNPGVFDHDGNIIWQFNSDTQKMNIPGLDMPHPVHLEAAVSGSTTLLAMAHSLPSANLNSTIIVNPRNPAAGNIWKYYQYTTMDGTYATLHFSQAIPSGTYEFDSYITP